MPGIIVHTLLGARVLDRWRADPTAAPFPASDDALRATFLSGCMGPDMGMYPGGDTLFSDLAHYVKSGELARTLVREARTDPQRAFAWGWATHVLADALIHPLVNLAAGDARGGGPLTYADDPGLHLAVEVGADGCQFDRWRQTDMPRLPHLPGGTVEYLGDAYRKVYGPAIQHRSVRTSVAAWARWHRFSVALGGAASAKLYGRARGRHGLYGWARVAVKLYTGVCSRGSVLHALTHPLAPSARAEALIDRSVAEFPDRFAELQRGMLESLPDYNLDTGAVEQPATYPLTLKALARLQTKTGQPV